MGVLFAKFKRFTPKQKQEVVNTALEPSHLERFSVHEQTELRRASTFQQKGQNEQSDKLLQELFYSVQFRKKMSIVCEEVIPNCTMIPEEKKEEKKEALKEEKTQPLDKFSEILSAYQSDNPPQIITSLWKELRKSAKKELSDENITFLQDVIEFEKKWKGKVPKKSDENDYVEELNIIYTKYVPNKAEKQINVASQTRKKLENDQKNNWKDSNKKLLAPQQIWEVAKKSVIKMIRSDTYGRFRMDGPLEKWKKQNPTWKQQYEEWQSLEKRKLQNKAMVQQRQKQQQITKNIKGNPLFQAKQKQHEIDKNDKGVGKAGYGDFGDDIYGQYDFYDSIISERDTGSGNTGYHYSPQYDSRNYGQRPPEYLVYPHYNQQIGEYNSGLINANNWIFGVTIMMNIFLFILLLSSLCCICMLIYGFLVHKVIKSATTIPQKPYLRMAEEDSMNEV